MSSGYEQLKTEQERLLRLSYQITLLVLSLGV
jgi:hypothetical protein